MNAKIKFTVVTALFCFLVWYFFIKSYDYRINFETTQPSGAVYSILIAWNNWESPSEHKVVNTYQKTPFTKLSQEFKVSDSIINIDWEIFRKNDSITKVTAYLTDKNNSLVQKLKVPFVKTDFVKRGIETLKKIRSGLKSNEDNYKISNIYRSQIPKQYCAYIKLQSMLSEKANKMMTNNDYMLNYFIENNIKLIGHPFLEVTSWNKENETISFDFCFPVPYNENYKDSKDIKFKMSEEKPALKTIFNGNYRISDQAWFAILDYAERNNIKIDSLPTEIFKNDPHIGGNELEWVAEIYMPIADE